MNSKNSSKESKGRTARKAAVIGSLIVAASAGGSLLVATQAYSSPSFVKPTADPADYALGLMSETQTADDLIPEAYDLNALGIDGILPETTRYLGSSDTADLWAGTDKTGLLCLITAIPGPDQLAGASCFTADGFAEHGGALRVVSEAQSVEAYLLPDAPAQRQSVPSEVSAISQASPTSNLLVIDAEAPADAREAADSATLAELFPEPASLED